MAVVIIILVIVIGLLIVEKTMAGKNTFVDSGRPPQAVRQQVESLFNSKLNRFDLRGTELLVTPKLRKDAPTLHIDVSSSGAGTKVHMWGEVVTEKRGIGPWVPKHGLYVWRKQRSIAKAIEAAG